MTKAFTATTIGELVAEGKLDWDTTPVNKYLPEFELKDPLLTSQLTFVDLLSHRSVSPRDLHSAKKESNFSRLMMQWHVSLVRTLWINNGSS